MSDELGTIHFGSQHGANEVFLGRDFGTTPNYSEETAAKIDREIKKIIDESYALARELLLKYREKLDFITEFLLRNEIMDDEQFELAMKEGVTMEEVEALVTEKKRRSEEENKRRQAEIDEKKRQEEQTRRELEKALGISDDEEENTPEIEAPQNDENSENANTSIDETEK
jgi:cell division protease FtsH